MIKSVLLIERPVQGIIVSCTGRLTFAHFLLSDFSGFATLYVCRRGSIAKFHTDCECTDQEFNRFDLRFDAIVNYTNSDDRTYNSLSIFCSASAKEAYRFACFHKFQFNKKEDQPMQLELKHITKSFDSKNVLKDVNFQFEQGKIYGLLGRNGAGKTTLFNCLSGELQPDEGNAYLTRDGQEATLKPESIGYVFATPILPEFLTGYEFLKFYIDINQEQIQSNLTIDDYFELIQIRPDDRHRLIKSYSHGMKNKIQMLCFIISKPPVILLDEPLTSLDVVVALEIKKLLREMKDNHIILFSTHILQLATDLCDEIVVLNDGTLEQVDHSIIHNPQFEEKIIHMLKDENEA